MIVLLIASVAILGLLLAEEINLYLNPPATCIRANLGTPPPGKRLMTIEEVKKYDNCTVYSGSEGWEIYVL